jgi:hypothetical protein
VSTIKHPTALRAWRLRPVLAIAVLIGALMVPLTGEAVACTTTHGRPYLTDFRGGSDAGSQFYAGVEGSSATATIGVTPGHCVIQGGSTAAFQTEDGLATAVQDYVSVSGTSQKLCADVDGPAQEDVYCPPDSEPQRTVMVPITNDMAAEAAVEPFLFRLTSGHPSGLAEPSSARIHVIDDDGSARATLEPTIDGAMAVTYSRSESFPRVLIPVFGAGNPAPSSVGYTLTPDPQSPATDGQDYRVASPNPLPIPPDRVGFIDIAIVNDDLGEPPESVVITLPGGAAPSTTTLTILDNEENQPPSSRLHHPRHRWKYKKSDYRIREVHVFTSDTGGSGVVGAQFGLRRNMKNGDCLWLTEEGWQKKDCSNRQWLDTRYDDVGQLWYYRPGQLKSSVGTRIKDYTAFSRAIDGAKNLEREFNERRNDNTFEVKRRRKR